MVKASAQKSATKTPAPVETPVAPVVATPAPVEGGKRKSKKETSSTPAPEVVATSAPAPVPEVVATPAPVEGGKRKSKKETASTPAPVSTVVATPAPVPEVVATPAPVEGGKRKSKKETTSVSTPAPEVVATPAPETTVVATTAEAQEGTESSTRGKRFFRCVYRGTNGTVVNAGRYSGKKPKQAACKALTAIVKKNNVTTGESVVFLIQECTRGSKKKKYSYEGSQVNLETPVQITITKKDGSASKISYAKNNVLKKIQLSECGDLVNVELGEDEAQPVVEEVKVQASRKTRTSSKKVAKGGKKSGKSTRTTKAK